MQCGVTDIHKLTIDHINDDGAADRAVHGSGQPFYVYLKHTVLREDLQVLCWNCNCKKGKELVREIHRRGLSQRWNKTE